MNVVFISKYIEELTEQGQSLFLWQNAKYINYEKADATIKSFWSVFHDLPEGKKKDFLGKKYFLKTKQTIRLRYGTAHISSF